MSQTLVMSRVPSTVPFGFLADEVAYEVFDKSEPGKAMRRVWVPYVVGGTEADEKMLASAASRYLSAEQGQQVPVSGVEVVDFEMGIFTVEVR